MAGLSLADDCRHKVLLRVRRLHLQLVMIWVLYLQVLIETALGPAYETTHSEGSLSKATTTYP